MVSGTTLVDVGAIVCPAVKVFALARYGTIVESTMRLDAEVVRDEPIPKPIFAEVEVPEFVIGAVTDMTPEGPDTP